MQTDTHAPTLLNTRHCQHYMERLMVPPFNDLVKNNVIIKTLSYTNRRNIYVRRCTQFNPFTKMYTA